MQLGERQNMSFFIIDLRGGEGGRGGRGCKISINFLRGYTLHYYYHYSKESELNRLSTYFTLSFFPVKQ